MTDTASSLLMHEVGPGTAPPESPWADIDLWVFDLDNTLYPRLPDMWAQVGARMGGYIAERLNVDFVEARRIQKAYLHEYGLTARGLQLHHGIDALHFMRHVHDVPLHELTPDPVLKAAIQALPGRKVIYTNNVASQAERVLEHLHLEDVFDALYDIAAMHLEPKPSASGYHKLLGWEGVPAARAAMFEDSARNLLVPHELGMTTIWTPTNCDWARAGAEGVHVHHVTDDITGFLTALRGRL